MVERIILTRLKDHAEEKSLTPNEQFGLREDHSIELQVVRLMEYITSAFKEGKTVQKPLIAPGTRVYRQR